MPQRTPTSTPSHTTSNKVERHPGHSLSSSSLPQGISQSIPDWIEEEQQIQTPSSSFSNACNAEEHYAMTSMSMSHTHWHNDDTYEYYHNTTKTQADKESKRSKVDSFTSSLRTRQYSYTELVDTLRGGQSSRVVDADAAASVGEAIAGGGASSSLSLPASSLGNNNNNNNNNPELERRVLDFQLAQRKRIEKYGYPHKTGIFGMYAHLSNVRIDLEWSEDAAWRRSHGKPYLSWSDFDAMSTQRPIRPWFTYVMIVVCSIMLIVEFGLNDWKVEPMSENPLVGPSAEALVRAGARDTKLIIEEDQWFRIFTPLFLHGGIIHYVVNMAALWFIGGAVEVSHGTLRGMVLFFIPGVGGNILSAIFLPQYISVGASGGIFGLIGGCLADIALNWKLIFLRSGNRRSANGNTQGNGDSNGPETVSRAAVCRRFRAKDPEDGPDDNNNNDMIEEHPSQHQDKAAKRNAWAIFWLVLEIIINIVFGLTPYVDNFSHLGGLAYGFGCGWSVLSTLPVDMFLGVVASATAAAFSSRTCHPCYCSIKLLRRSSGGIATLVVIAVSIYALATMQVGDTPCPNCRYVSCVPFPLWTEQKWWYCDDCDFVTATLYKNPDGDEDYDAIELNCPGNGSVGSNYNNGTSSTSNLNNSYNAQNNTVWIPIDGALGSDATNIQRQLPSYCRALCPTLFN